MPKYISNLKFKNQHFLRKGSCQLHRDFSPENWPQLTHSTTPAPPHPHPQVVMMMTMVVVVAAPRN